MKYKVGQKVRVVEWVDMPTGIKDEYGYNSYKVGEVGTLVNIPTRVMSIDYYDIIFENEEYPIGLFEKELEPVIMVGEQLMFAFMQTSGYQR